MFGNENQVCSSPLALSQATDSPLVNTGIGVSLLLLDGLTVVLDNLRLCLISQSRRDRICDVIKTYNIQ